MKPNSINSSKKPELKSIATIVIVLSLVALLSSIALAIPNSLTLQGKLTNLAGASQQGTFNFTFKIYDAAANGNELWAVINQSVTTDANGIYDVILTSINLTFADQYYLGISVQGENESVPRINLTSVPYSFRANTSEGLNPNQSFVVRNLSITGNATVGDGTTTLTISTQGFNLTAIGNVFIGSNLSVAGNSLFVDSLNQRVGIGTASPLYKLDVKAADGMFFGVRQGIYATAVALQSSDDANSGIPMEFIGTSWRFAKIDGLTTRMFIDTTGNIGIGTASPTYKLQVNGETNLNNTLYVNGTSGNVGIGTTTPGQTLHVVGSANISTTLNAPVINTTLSTQNLTISSAAGSVIIRLG